MVNFRNAAKLSLLVSAFALISCNQTYFQVYDVKYESMTLDEEALRFENKDVEILYNLWGDGGKLGFVVKNKTDRDIFINMQQTFFIRNGKAHDYFHGVEKTTTKSAESSHGFSLSNYLTRTAIGIAYLMPGKESLLGKVVKGESKSVTIKEKETVCIPAHAFKTFYEYDVNPELNVSCSKKTDFPKRSAEVATYDEATTPLSFSNRIAYGFSPKGEGLEFVENKFHISRITNFSKKAAVENTTVGLGCCGKTKTEVEAFKVGGPDKFYKVYTKNQPKH